MSRYLDIPVKNLPAFDAANSSAVAGAGGIVAQSTLPREAYGGGRGNATSLIAVEIAPAAVAATSGARLTFQIAARFAPRCGWDEKRYVDCDRKRSRIAGAYAHLAGGHVAHLTQSLTRRSGMAATASRRALSSAR